MAYEIFLQDEQPTEDEKPSDQPEEGDMPSEMPPEGDKSDDNGDMNDPAA